MKPNKLDQIVRPPQRAQQVQAIHRYFVFTILESAMPLHQITAQYGGNTSAGILGSASGTVEQDVQAAAALATSSNLNPVYFGNDLIFTASVTSKAAKTATGTVLFLDGGTQIRSAPLAGHPAVATFKISTLSLGTHTIVATYVGDAYTRRRAASCSARWPPWMHSAFPSRQLP